MIVFERSLAALMVSAAASGWEIAGVALSIAVLLVAASTLWFTYPKPAKLDVDRLSEMDRFTADLLFFLFPWPNPDPPPGDPGAYLLQLRVAVANVGRRKAVLSTIAIEDFTTSSGKTMFLPESVQGPLWGTRRTQQIAYDAIGRPNVQEVSMPGPVVLGPDDVVVVTFRSRRGIDWSDRWDLEKLRSYYDDLKEPIVSARIQVLWRRVSWRRSAMEVRRDDFTVDLKVLNQEEYVDAIRERTSDFTVRPAIESSPIMIE
jgi:hypothetical protein